MPVLSVAWPPAPLTTERLVLRKPEASDRSGLIELLCSEDVRRFLGGPRPREAVEAMPEVPADHPGVFAVERDGCFVGAVTIDRRDPDRLGHLDAAGGELEVSYAFLPAYWGQGLAFEAVEAALEWARNRFPEEPVLLVTQVANARSMALAARLGFTEHARFVEHGAEQWLGVRWPTGREAPAISATMPHGLRPPLP